MSLVAQRSLFLPRVEAEHFCKALTDPKSFQAVTFWPKITMYHRVSPGRYHYHPGVQHGAPVTNNPPMHEKKHDPEKCHSLGMLNANVPPSCLKGGQHLRRWPAIRFNMCFIIPWRLGSGLSIHLWLRIPAASANRWYVQKRWESLVLTKRSFI